jgi:hypothetical protein
MTKAELDAQPSVLAVDAEVCEVASSGTGRCPTPRDRLPLGRQASRFDRGWATFTPCSCCGRSWLGRTRSTGSGDLLGVFLCAGCTVAAQTQMWDCGFDFSWI